MQITWQQGFAENMPFSDKTFDYVTCCHTLEHVKDLDKAVAELKRVARMWGGFKFSDLPASIPLAFHLRNL
ncbi:MAG: class I SAM-dependent methyltransferase [candidate division KSB1 bacterium]|nr:class I SAM-dependent methyltransferase [candidate division KSB1 bacterium]MDZ7368993.1 class I SAM-dependent methyltransferase [candidate division KSB1 bacterium]MDZ7406969.1 class I SAM-dependent methyltransferase [candidate division KSB1 bacterium]